MLLWCASHTAAAAATAVTLSPAHRLPELSPRDPSLHHSRVDVEHVKRPPLDPGDQRERERARERAPVCVCGVVYRASQIYRLDQITGFVTFRFSGVLLEKHDLWAVKTCKTVRN